jgi:hypothetical protein
VLLLYLIFKLVTQVYYIIYIQNMYALDKKRTIWSVTHPITKYHIHVPVVSFHAQGLPRRLRLTVGLADVSAHGMDPSGYLQLTDVL